MKKNQPQQKHKRTSAHASAPPHDPYWMRAHKDWRFLTVIFLMLAAMATYVIGSSLAWRWHRDPVPLVDAVGQTK